jgi:hypothetical protein
MSWKWDYGKFIVIYQSPNSYVEVDQACDSKTPD